MYRSEDIGPVRRTIFEFFRILTCVVTILIAVLPTLHVFGFMALPAALIDNGAVGFVMLSLLWLAATGFPTLIMFGNDWNEGILPHFIADRLAERRCQKLEERATRATRKREAERILREHNLDLNP